MRLDGTHEDRCDNCGIRMISDRKQRVDGQTLCCVECTHRARQQPERLEGQLVCSVRRILLEHTEALLKNNSHEEARLLLESYVALRGVS